MALSKELTKEKCITVALDELNYKRLTYRGAQAKYGIPVVTWFCMHHSSKYG